MGRRNAVAMAMAMALALLALLHLAEADPNATAAKTGLEVAHMLGKHPELSEFRKWLLRTQIAAKLGEFQKVTLLAVPNDAMPRTVDATALKRIMSVHVLLDYVDEAALAKLTPQDGLPVATLYQTTGLVQSKTGPVLIDRQQNGSVAFRSVAHDGSANYVKSLMQVPGKVSVLEVNGLIVPPEVDSKHPFSHMGSIHSDVPLGSVALATPSPAPASSESASASASAPAPALVSAASPFDGNASPGLVSVFVLPLVLAAAAAF